MSVFARASFAAAVTAALALLGGGTGCGGDLPPPTLRAVSPSAWDQGQAPVLFLELDAVLPLVADHGRKTVVLDESIRVGVGGHEPQVVVSFASAPGQWEAPMPVGLPPGTHAVEVTLADGRSARLPDAVTIREATMPEGFTIDPVADQRRGVPFTLTVRATGPAAETYSGVVQLSLNQGSMTPNVSENFVAGVLAQEVTVGSVGEGIILSVDDGSGHRAQSNPFRVRP